MSLRALLTLCRPRQWTKNLLCLAGPLFTTDAIGRDEWSHALLTMTAFCLMSSAVYIVNDIVDAPADRRSARKASRPVASGQVSVLHAGALACSLLALVAFIGARLPESVGIVLLLYLGLNSAYSLVLKHVVLVDVFCISLGFILRLLAGIYAIQDTPTAWIVLCTMFLTLFLGFAKRRAELASIAQSGGPDHRPVLSSYSVEYLDFLVSATSTMAIVTYALFTTAGGRDPTMLLTVLPVVYGIFHYKKIVMLDSGGDAPESIVLADPVLWACGIVWLAGFLCIAHFSPGLLR